MNHLLLHVTAAPIALGMAATCSWAQCNYTVRLLAKAVTPQCPTYQSPLGAASINNFGIVSGYVSPCAGNAKPCLWNAQGEISLISIPGQTSGYAWSIADDGTVVGDTYLGVQGYWFIWKAGIGGPVLYDCPKFILSNGISAVPNGGVGGVYCALEDPAIRLHYKTPTGEDIDISLQVSSRWTTQGSDAHPDGIVVGGIVAGSQNPNTRAFRWWNGLVTILEATPGGYTSIGQGTNRWGDVVGQGRYHPPGWPRGDPVRAFAYIDGVMIDIGFIAPNFIASWGQAINDLRQVVGSTSNWSSIEVAEPTLWQDGKLYNLNALVVDPLLVSLEGAHEINDRGDIVGSGYYGGEYRQLVLEPIRERVGDADLDCRVGMSDLQLVLRAWGTSYAYDHGPGDVTNDSVVDARDLAWVLGDWDA